MSDTPVTRYARADDGVHIAYQTVGEGSFDLVVAPGFVSHVELTWEKPGSGISFSERGEFDLKGVPGRWTLFAVAG